LTNSYIAVMKICGLLYPVASFQLYFAAGAAVVVAGAVAQADTTRVATTRHADNTMAFLFILFSPSI